MDIDEASEKKVRKKVRKSLCEWPIWGNIDGHGSRRGAEW